MKKKGMKNWKNIRTMKSSDELSKEEGKKIKTTELWVKKCKCIELILFF